MVFEPKIVGLTAAGNVIGAHAVKPADYINPTIPGGGPGRLDPGHTFQLQLDDPGTPANPDFSFTGDMNVSGTNPNQP